MKKTTDHRREALLELLKFFHHCIYSFRYYYQKCCRLLAWSLFGQLKKLVFESDDKIRQLRYFNCTEKLSKGYLRCIELECRL